MCLYPIYPFPMLHLLERWKQKEIQKGLSSSEENEVFWGLKIYQMGEKDGYCRCF